MGRKLAGLTGETYGNWLCIRYLLSANRSEGKASEAGCWRLRNWMQNAAAANMPLWTPFPFRLPVFTRIMGTGRFYPRSISLHRETALLYERNTLIQRNGDNDETHEPTDWLLRAGLRSLRRQNRNDYKRYCPARKLLRFGRSSTGVPITPDMMSCTGCRVDGPKTPFCDKLCPIRPASGRRALIPVPTARKWTDVRCLGTLLPTIRRRWSA